MRTTIGLDLGGTKCLGVVVDADGTVLAEHRVATPRGGDAIIDALASVASALRAETTALPGKVVLAGVGVGAPGLVDHAGVLHAGANLPGVTMLPIRAALEERLQVAVRVENDASAAAWGEFRFGGARGVQSAILVTQGTGIGGGIIEGGRLLRGAHGFAGEIGHMVVDPSGPPCPCGKRGCWERFASGSALGYLARTELREKAGSPEVARLVELAGGDLEAVRGEHVTAAAGEGDNAAVELVSTFAWWVALGLANLTELCDPERIVLGGGLAESGEVLLGPTRASFRELVQASDHRPPVEIVVAELGSRAGAIGAAVLAGEP